MPTELAAHTAPFGDAGVGPRDLGAIAETPPRHLHEAALGEDPHARLTDRDDLADLASADRAKGRGDDLARIEQVELALTCRGPGAGRRVAAADQIVHEIDMGRPVDTGLGPAPPALIGGSAFVLSRFGRATRNNQVGGLYQRFHSEWEDLVEIERAGGVVGAD